MFMFFFVSLLFPPEAAGESAQSDSDDIIVHSQATGRKVSERPGFVYLLTGLSLLSVQIDLQLVVGRGSGSCCLFFVEVQCWTGFIIYISTSELQR